MSTGPLLMAKADRLSIKLDADLVQSARLIAALTGEDQQDLLARILRPILTRMEAEELAKRVASGLPAPKRSRRKAGEGGTD
jgi:hypothetical protein